MLSMSALADTDGSRPHTRADPFAHARIEQLFEAQVDRTPDAVALVHRGTATTYAELDARANRIAHRLRAAGVGPEATVAVCMGRSPTMVASLLAVLKAGGAYVPLDPEYPPDRLSYMLDDSGAKLMLVDAAAPFAPDYGGAALDASASEGWPSTRPDPVGSARDLAAVIYTSGSTGMPKGVMLEHTAARFIRWAISEFTPAELAMTAAGTSICFDPHVLEIFVPLSAGGTVLLKDSPLDPFGPDERPTLLAAVPSTVASMLDRGGLPDSLEAIVIGGERLTAGLVRRIRRDTGLRRIHNHYGPTEATTAAAAAWVGPCDDGIDPPIGTAICGNVLVLVGADGREVADGLEGELHIAGPMLARGYVGPPALDRDSFVRLEGAPARSVYRTGDIMRRRPDGDFDYVGRAGDFVKLNGRRVAPAEVEAAMLRVPGVCGAVATHGIDRRGHDRLVAHVVMRDGGAITLGELRCRLRARLPHAMLPSVLHVHDALPLTLNGKVDRTALPGVPASAPSVEAVAGSGDPALRAVADAFARELALTGVGPDDDFFELGGDSLSAVAVASALEGVIGRSVSPALILHAPTPRLLLGALGREVHGDGRHLVRLQAAGAEPPIYCVPDVDGRPVSFTTIARRMAPTQPVFGLVVGPAAEAMMARPAMEALASAYVLAIVADRPEGPVRVAGYSFGGAVAQEVARRLEGLGREVALVLIDAPNRRMPLRPGLFAGWMARAAAAALRADGLARTAVRALRQARDLALHLRKAAPAWVPASDVALARAQIAADRHHRPLPFGGRTLMVVCRRQSVVNAFRQGDGMLGWRGLLSGPVTTLVADVAHQDIVHAAYAGALCDAMREFFAAGAGSLSPGGSAAP